MSESKTPWPQRLSSTFQRALPVRLVVRYQCQLVFFVLLCLLGFATRTVFTPPASKPVPAKWVDKRYHWEKYASVNRLFGGVRTLVPKIKNVPEYPTIGIDTSRGKFHRPNPRDAGPVRPRSSKHLRAQHDHQHEHTSKSASESASTALSHTEARARAKGPSMNSIVFNPYPNYESPEYTATYGVKHDCYLDSRKNISIPPTRAFPGIPSGFPEPVMGSPYALGLDHNVCFDRYGRYGPYGLGYNQSMGGTGASMGGDNLGNENVWNGKPVDYRGVKWNEVQKRCIAANSERFSNVKKSEMGTAPKKRMPRTVVMLRTVSNFQYTKETIIWIRSLIAELSLLSGGEYTVHFLIDVQDPNVQIWADDEIYKSVLKDSLPEEFAGMGTLWSAQQMKLIYQGLEPTPPGRNVNYRSIYAAYRGGWLPMQYFAYRHPEFDYYWNLEMDIRYTGNWYHLFDKLGKWTKQQPRKGMWERNGRFYVPAEHGSWDEFVRRVEHQTTYGADSPSNVQYPTDPNDKSQPKKPPPKGERFMWGPERAKAPVDFMQANDEGVPPRDIKQDNHQWGVGEEADLIALNPLFDPVGTTWSLRNDIVGYTTESQTPGQPVVTYEVPRRAALVTNSRLSRKLLLTMHRETYQKHHHMMNELWAPSCALQHGYKAVYAPHPMWFDRRWPTATLDSTFNAGKNGAVGGGRYCVFGAYEHNFRGASWFYNAQLPIELYKRWLGYKDSEGRGGEDFEKNGEGRMCLPPMLYHPIKPFELAATKEG